MIVTWVATSSITKAAPLVICYLYVPETVSAMNDFIDDLLLSIFSSPANQAPADYMIHCLNRRKTVFSREIVNCPILPNWLFSCSYLSALVSQGMTTVRSGNYCHWISFLLLFFTLVSIVIVQCVYSCVVFSLWSAV